MAKESGFVSENLADRLKRRSVPKSELQLPSSEEFEALVDWVLARRTCYSYPAAEMIEFLAYSGMRLNEAVNVCWKDIDAKNQQIEVTGGEDGTKNRLSRRVPIVGGNGEAIAENCAANRERER